MSHRHETPERQRQIERNVARQAHEYAARQWTRTTVSPVLTTQEMADLVNLARRASRAALAISLPLPEAIREGIEAACCDAEASAAAHEHWAASVSFSEGE